MLHETKNKLKRKITTNRNTNPISYHFSSFIFFFFCCFLLTTKSVIFFILMLLLWICVMLIFAPTSVLSAFSFLQNGQTKQNEKKNENITATCILFDLSSRVTPCAICLKLNTNTAHEKNIIIYVLYELYCINDTRVCPTGVFLPYRIRK